MGFTALAKCEEWLMDHSPNMQTRNIRRKGLPGHHLVVVPEPVRKAAAGHPLLRGLLVTDAGYFPTASGHRVERPLGAATHLLMVCLHGQGWIRSGGREWPVVSGEIVWLSAHAPHAYGADEENPWTIAWAHFRGEDVAAWQRELGWAAKGPITQFHGGIEGATTLGLDKVYPRLESGYSIQHLLGASVALRAVFCAAIALAKGAGTMRSAGVRTAAMREEMIANPARAYRLGELATGAGLSVPHFCLLFRQQTGYAPIDFLIRQRIRKACRLLDNTSAAVATVAAEVGFEDPYYFSRRFHRVMGLSPRAYRKSVKG
jgi:AraC family transcriptional regulator of arabinose operon